LTRCCGCASARVEHPRSLDLVTADGPLRVFTLLHDARPVLLDFGEPGGFDIPSWALRRKPYRIPDEAREHLCRRAPWHDRAGHDAVQ